MPMFRTILVAADFSESSREAFRIACSLAREDRTRLFVLHVKEPLIVFAEVGAPMILPDETPQAFDAIREHLRAVYVPDQPVDVEYRTVQGAAADEILQLADEVGSDLIVLGTHGRSGLARLLVGSVAETVMHKARCPVLALRSPKHLDSSKASAEVAHSAR